MLQVRKGVRSEEVRGDGEHVLFVEGSEDGSLDQAVLRALLRRELRIETMGPSYSVKSAAQALARHHPNYYFLVDRDHHDDQFVEDCWRNFPDPDTDNLLVWRRREIENYFLDPPFLLESAFCQSEEETLTEMLLQAAQEKLFLDVANLVISSVREEQKTTWMEHFSNPAEFATKNEALARLTSAGEFEDRRRRVSSMITKPKLRRRFAEYLEMMTGKGENLVYGKGKWIEMMKGKKVLAALINSSEFNVANADGESLTGKDKVYEVVRELAVKNVPSRPSDFLELRRLIQGRVRGAV